MRSEKVMLAGVVLSGLSALACCMVPASYEGSIGQDAQEAVLIHDGDREELVLRINYRISGETLPTNFAWVVTVPNEPDAYAVATSDLFKDMFDLSVRLVTPPSGPRIGCAMTGMRMPMDGLEFGERVRVGPCDIQPVRGVGADALEGLNAWLASRGFPAEPPEHMRYFVEENFTFLCIRVLPPSGESASSASGMLPPLHLSFRSERPYYPLRFSSRQGVFNLNLHTITRSKLDYSAAAETLAKINWASQRLKRNVRLREKSMPDSLKVVYAESVWEKAEGKWYYNNLLCDQVNKGDTIRTWHEDVFLPLK